MMTTLQPITLHIQPAGLGSLGRGYEVPAWQYGSLAIYHDRFRSHPRWQISHVATCEPLATCRTEEQARAALPKLAELAIDWSWAVVPCATYWQALIAIAPIVAQLFQQGLVDAETANLAPFWAAGARLHLALDTDLPAELRAILGLSVGPGASLLVSTPAMMVVHVQRNEEQWNLGLEGQEWQVIPRPKIQPDGTFPPTAAVRRRLLAGWFEDVCYSRQGTH